MHAERWSSFLHCGGGYVRFMASHVVLLLDNHHPPDRRAEWVSAVLRGAGVTVRIVAWDRRIGPLTGPDREPPSGEEVVRIASPAAWGAGGGTLAAMMRFWRSAYGRRKELLAGADALIASDIYLLPLGLAMTVNTRLPLLYDAREDWAALEAARRPRSVREIVTRAETALARRTSAVIVPGESRARRWRRDGIDPVVLRNVGITAPRAGTAPRWDVASAGLLAEQRRPDLVLGLAARRPDLRFVITGVGRLEDDVRSKAEALPNVDFLGFVDDVDEVLAKSRVIVYGEDPNTPYSPLVCPSTLYQAVRLRRPLVFYCGGEPAEAAGRFRIGVRCDPHVDALSVAVDTARARDDWEFDDAWAWLREGAEEAFLSRFRSLVPVP